MAEQELKCSRQLGKKEPDSADKSTEDNRGVKQIRGAVSDLCV